MCLHAEVLNKRNTKSIRFRHAGVAISILNLCNVNNLRSNLDKTDALRNFMYKGETI